MSDGIAMAIPLSAPDGEGSGIGAVGAALRGRNWTMKSPGISLRICITAEGAEAAVDGAAVPPASLPPAGFGALPISAVVPAGPPGAVVDGGADGESDFCAPD